MSPNSIIQTPQKTSLHTQVCKDVFFVVNFGKSANLLPREPLRNLTARAAWEGEVVGDGRWNEYRIF